jgi:hypothetical protein
MSTPRRATNADLLVLFQRQLDALVEAFDEADLVELDNEAVIVHPRHV